MADVNIKYKGSSIAELSDSGTKTLKTSGKYCEGDITVEYTTPQPIDTSITITENGVTNTPDGIRYNPITVQVQSLRFFKYVCFTATVANSNVKLTSIGNWAQNWTIYYSTDKINWVQYTFNTIITLAQINDYVCFAGLDNISNVDASTENKYHRFVVSHPFAVSGNCCGLLSQTSEEMTPYCFNGLFAYCNLTSLPELPSISLSRYCYLMMFYGCSGFTRGPVLPASVLAEACYAYMFAYSSIQFAEELASTWAANRCYSYMFYNCTSLTSQVIIRTQYLAHNCFEYMFYGCQSLGNIKLYYMESFTTSYTYPFNNWVYGVASTGVFYYNGPDSTHGVSAIPVGWTVAEFGNLVLTDTSKQQVYNNVTAQIVDANLVAGNIKEGVNVLGVTGTVHEGITPSGTKQITSMTATDVTNYATAQVVDADLVAENILKDKNILGIVGTLEKGELTYDPDTEEITITGVDITLEDGD